ncbi:MAG: hypothetical protein M9926_11440 [Lentimicrobium sp.]|uniref:hypothetical protein n=1 Tax=Lentimicrobium sp. TaxID=2034841 RepID=UPI0025EEBD2C|nr:hypothetical protein [Lentimicrobium sp.]MCO5257356.1 hypothetical protein [Lentimicrobium sp.]
MNKDSNLNFCYVCKNKGFNVSRGVFCGLTNETPSFRDNCELYLFDSAEKEKLKNVRRKNLELNTNHEKFDNIRYAFGVKFSLLRETRKCGDDRAQSLNYLPTETYFLKNYKWAILGELFALFFLIVIFNLNADITKGNIISEYIFPVFIIYVTAKSSYYFYKIKKGKKVLIISNNGIEHYKQGRFSWQEILLTLVKSKRGWGNQNFDYLLLSLVTSSEPIVIPLGTLLNTCTIENAIELYKEKYESTMHNKG